MSQVQEHFHSAAAATDLWTALQRELSFLLSTGPLKNDLMSDPFLFIAYLKVTRWLHAK